MTVRSIGYFPVIFKHFFHRFSGISFFLRQLFEYQKIMSMRTILHWNLLRARLSLFAQMFFSFVCLSFVFFISGVWRNVRESYLFQCNSIFTFLIKTLFALSHSLRQKQNRENICWKPRYSHMMMMKRSDSSGGSCFFSCQVMKKNRHLSFFAFIAFFY